MASGLLGYALLLLLRFFLGVSVVAVADAASLMDLFNLDFKRAALFGWMKLALSILLCVFVKRSFSVAASCV